MRDAGQARHHICNLLYRYAEAVDDGDMGTLRQLFQHAVLYAGNREAAYPGDQVERMFADFTIYYDQAGKRVDFPAQKGRPCTQHIITNPIIDLAADGGSATARSRFTVVQALPDFPLQLIIAGRYFDEFELRGETWRFRSRMYRTDLSGDLSRHLLQPPPEQAQSA